MSVTFKVEILVSYNVLQLINFTVQHFNHKLMLYSALLQQEICRKYHNLYIFSLNTSTRHGYILWMNKKLKLICQ